MPHEGTTTIEDMKDKARDEGIRKLSILDEGRASDECCYTGLLVKVDLALEIMNNYRSGQYCQISKVGG